jgi:hypothetical protein
VFCRTAQLGVHSRLRLAYVPLAPRFFSAAKRSSQLSDKAGNVSYPRGKVFSSDVRNLPRFSAQRRVLPQLVPNSRNPAYQAQNDALCKCTLCKCKFPFSFRLHDIGSHQCCDREGGGDEAVLECKVCARQRKAGCCATFALQRSFGQLCGPRFAFQMAFGEPEVEEEFFEGSLGAGPANELVEWRVW